MATVRGAMFGSWMDPQDPKNVGRDTAQDLSGLVGKFAALKAVAHHWLTDPEYAAFTHRLEAAHAAAEAALVVQRSTCQRSLIGCRDCETREEVLARRIATAFSWAHASWDNAGIGISCVSRAGGQGGTEDSALAKRKWVAREKAQG